MELPPRGPSVLAEVAAKTPPCLVGSTMYFHITSAYGAQVTIPVTAWGAGGCQELHPDQPHGMCWENMGDPSLAAPSSSSPSPLLLAYCRELNMEPLKVFLFQNIFCISYNRYYNDSMHLLKIYGFRDRKSVV